MLPPPWSITPSPPPPWLAPPPPSVTSPPPGLPRGRLNQLPRPALKLRLMLMLSTTATGWDITVWDTTDLVTVLILHTMLVTTTHILTHSDTITSTTTCPTPLPWLPQPPWSRLPLLPSWPPPC